MSGQYLDCGSTKYLNQLTMKHSESGQYSNFDSGEVLKIFFFLIHYI